MISIVNLRNRKPKQPWQVKVDRSSPLGNIFYMKDESHRDEVCDKYQEWFNNTVLQSGQVSSYNELVRLYSLYKEHGKLELFCWCAPKRCHAETIKKFLEPLNN